MYYLTNAHWKTKTNECFLASLARQSLHKAFYWYTLAVVWASVWTAGVRYRTRDRYPRSQDVVISPFLAILWREGKNCSPSHELLGTMVETL